MIIRAISPAVCSSWVANVHGARLGAPHQIQAALYEVLDVLNAPGLRSVAVDGEEPPVEHLGDEGRDHAPVVGSHHAAPPYRVDAAPTVLVLKVHQRVAVALREQPLTEVAAKEARPARNQRYQGSCLFFALLLLATPDAPVTEARL
jgi:hypothetical protein